MKLHRIEFSKEKVKLRNIFLSKIETNMNTPKYIKEIYGDFHLPIKDKFPYLYGSLIMTLDGKIGLEDQTKSNEISKGNFLDPDGGLADLWVLNLLRTYSDAIIFGSRTLNVEKNITGHIYDKNLEEIRINDLQKSMTVPWNIIISRKGDIDINHKIIQQDNIPTIILTTEMGYNKISNRLDKPIKEIEINSYEEELEQTKEVIIMYERDNKYFSIKSFLLKLKDLGLDKILVESPGLISILIKEQLMDEMFINYSCIYAGGDLTLGKRIPFYRHDYPGVDIMSLHIHKENFLYMRQKIKYRTFE
ncbi:dihydrofolate reductase family protein [Clostridium sp. D2Q-11]|uniref:Dihydrofolate reductase family protein n=1 Tax=Anaeromonas frigoriresistens TaxID=2683708 RepID=A0A942Z9X8_9FIRM|nr:dihydrofolate reductase family protein [Anaeromonas frigoriresistens]MBS4539783.1 dihydrofolate reductase family protein [Anaeromonas frigoriresistens]